jgi:hypothetical protein
MNDIEHDVERADGGGEERGGELGGEACEV